MNQSQREAVSKSDYKDYFSKAQKEKEKKSKVVKAPSVIDYLVRSLGG